MITWMRIKCRRTKGNKEENDKEEDLAD